MHMSETDDIRRQMDAVAQGGDEWLSPDADVVQAANPSAGAAGAASADASPVALASLSRSVADAA